MTLRLNDEVRKDLMQAFITTYSGCKINIYSGTRPATANDAIGGDNVLLATISLAGGATGLTFESTTPAGVATGKASETWSEDSAIATGTAAWFRMFESGDTPANASTTAARLDGSVGVSGADLNLSSVSIVAGIPVVIPAGSRTFTFPATP